MKVTWHNNGRGPRVVLEIVDDEDIMIDRGRAVELRDALIRVIDEIAATDALQLAELKAGTR